MKPEFLPKDLSTTLPIPFTFKGIMHIKWKLYFGLKKFKNLQISAAASSERLFCVCQRLKEPITFSILKTLLEIEYPRSV